MVPKGNEKLVFELHADVCKAMSSPKRLEIIVLLGEHERNVDDLAEKMGVSKANVSQHLAILREKGVVLPRREGVHVFYRITNPKIVQACTLMREVMFEKLISGAKHARLLMDQPEEGANR